MLDATLRAADTGQAMSQENVEIVRRAIAYEYDGVKATAPKRRRS